MKAADCPVANEPCQAMCLDGCRLREHNRYTAELEKERKELQSMLRQERTESEALLRQALHALVGSLENPNWAVAHGDTVAAITAIRARLGEGS